MEPVINHTNAVSSTRPIVSTLEIVCGLDARALPASESLTGMSGLTRGIAKLTIRILLPVSIIIVSVFVPSFDKIMSLLGSLAGFTICIILPCLFHLTLFKVNSVSSNVFWTGLSWCSPLSLRSLARCLLLYLRAHSGFASRL